MSDYANKVRALSDHDLERWETFLLIKQDAMPAHRDILLEKFLQRIDGEKKREPFGMQAFATDLVRGSIA